MFENVSSGPILTGRGFGRRSLLTSVGIHTAAVLGLFTLQFSRPNEPVAERPFRVMLLAPPAIRTFHKNYSIPKPASSASTPILLDPNSGLAPPILRSAPRVFEAPKPAPLPVPSMTIPREPSLEMEPARISAARPELPQFATAPAPPLKIDNLAAAFAAPVAAALQGVMRSASFGSSSVAGEARSLSANESPRPVVGTSFGAAAMAQAPQARALLKAGAFPGVEVGSTRASLAIIAPATNSKPLQILSKPNPEYTAEARRQQIEGEATLEVVFSAAGEARVLRLIRGLGHGLDEAAIAAAQGIRFHPAERAGFPVDFTAIVHIVFQLAY